MIVDSTSVLCAHVVSYIKSKLDVLGLALSRMGCCTGRTQTPRPLLLEQRVPQPFPSEHDTLYIQGYLIQTVAVGMVSVRN